MADIVEKELEDLLLEWFTWWQEDDAAPVKPPNALHVRTAVALQLLRMSREEKPTGDEPYQSCDPVCADGAHSLACVKARS